MEIPNFKLAAEEYDKIIFILSSLHDKLAPDSVFLINRNGQEIAHHGEVDGLDIQALSSLAASNLAATFGLAQVIGEQNFDRIQHRGERGSILIRPVGSYAFLLLLDRSNGRELTDEHSLRQASLILEDILRKSDRKDRKAKD